MAKTDVRISDSELQVLQILWEEAPLGATEIAERLPASHSWGLATVKTLLSRLMSKGAVTAEPQGRRFYYRPAVDRETIVSRQAGGLIDRLFGGRVSPLVAQLAEQREFDPDDLAELEALIRELRK